MKKINLKVIAFLLAGSFLTSSCIGSFALFNKYEKWQCNMTKNKFVNAIVGFILQPICGSITLFVDAIILNTIEFWSGNNPVTASTQTVMGTDGRLYTINSSQKGYEVTNSEGVVANFIHDSETDAWFVEQAGKRQELVRFNEDGTLQVTLQSGQTMTVNASQEGMQQVQTAVAYDNCFALN